MAPTLLEAKPRQSAFENQVARRQKGERVVGLTHDILRGIAPELDLAARNGTNRFERSPWNFPDVFEGLIVERAGQKFEITHKTTTQFDKDPVHQIGSSGVFTTVKVGEEAIVVMEARVRADSISPYDVTSSEINVVNLNPSPEGIGLGQGQNVFRLLSPLLEYKFADRPLRAETIYDFAKIDTQNIELMLRDGANVDIEAMERPFLDIVGDEPRQLLRHHVHRNGGLDIVVDTIDLPEQLASGYVGTKLPPRKLVRVTNPDGQSVEYFMVTSTDMETGEESKRGYITTKTHDGTFSQSDKALSSATGVLRDLLLN